MARGDLPTNGCLGVRMLTVLVDNLPESRGIVVGSLLALLGVLENGIITGETVTEGVLGVASGVRQRVGIHLLNRVLLTVNHGIDTHGEEVLMVLSVDLRSNNSTHTVGAFIFSQDVGVELASSLDFVFKSTVLVKVVVETIIVVGN